LLYAGIVPSLPILSGNAAFSDDASAFFLTVADIFLV
jgi:hypothetical protein